jgi:hypothetical protein
MAEEGDEKNLEDFSLAVAVLQTLQDIQPSQDGREDRIKRF